MFMGSSMNSILTPLLLIVLLIFINAYFAAAELAFVSVSRAEIRRLAEEDNKRAQRVLALLEESEVLLATIQISITLSGFLSSALAATYSIDWIVGLLPSFSASRELMMVLLTITLTYVNLVFGELFPKKIALQNPERIALATSGVIMWSRRILRPFVYMLTLSTKLLQLVTPIDFTKNRKRFTRDEMQMILSESRKAGSMDLEELSMMEGVLSLDTKIAREVMVPRTDAEMIDVDDPTADNLNYILSSPFSRIPLYRHERDNIIGVIHVKNLFKTVSRTGFDEIDWKEVANEPMFIPGTIYIDDLLIEFQREQQHMAILIDEYGGVEGLVTMEDLLEEIVGEIDDETDIETLSEIHRLADDKYSISGTLSLDKFNERFHEELASDDFDTIAGLVIDKLGYVPRSTEHVSVRINDNVLIPERIESGRIYSFILKKDPNRQHQVTKVIWDERLNYDQTLTDEEDSTSNR